MTKSADPSFTSFLPEPRAAAAMAFMFAIFAIGWRIPLPGVDFERVASFYSLSAEAGSGLSIFALGIIPLFTILVYVEVAKLAVPPLARWQANSSRNARQLAVVISVLTLILAAWQGHEVLIALGTGEIMRPEAHGLTFAALGSILASTALMIWLAADFSFRTSATVSGCWWPYRSSQIFPTRYWRWSDWLKQERCRGTSF